jgi:hypothetical protein
MNYCNCPNCRTDNCPAALDAEAVSSSRLVRRNLADALLVGQKLSNIAYNLQYQETLPKEERATLVSTYQEWDNAKRQLPHWMFHEDSEISPNGADERPAPAR